MVNLEKWEEIEYDAIEKGDKILRIVKHKDGTATTAKGVADIKYSSGWSTPDRFTLVRDGDYPFGATMELYRRKPKPFELPTEFGTIITAFPDSRYDDKRKWLVWDGEDWTGGSSCFRPAEVLSQFTDHRVERKGIEIG